jgi:hypothetical protein
MLGAECGAAGSEIRDDEVVQGGAAVSFARG